jgi:hypothetical protein
MLALEGSVSRYLQISCHIFQCYVKLAANHNKSYFDQLNVKVDLIWSKLVEIPQSHSWSLVEFCTVEPGIITTSKH